MGNAGHWKTDLVKVHAEGGILVLKKVSNDQRGAHELRSGCADRGAWSRDR